jgi:hypothetical protein
MREINHFKVFYNVDHLHVKRIQLVSFSYIVIEDTCALCSTDFLMNNTNFL